MTDDRRPAHDPTRALDGVHVPDQWADITARAARPEAGVEPLPLTTASKTRRPYVLAAAAVVAVLAIAAGLVLTQRDEGGDQVVAGPSAEGRLDNPANALGRRWALTSLVRNGQDVLLDEVDGWQQPTIDFTDVGAVTFRRCDVTTASATVQGDRLVIGDESMTATFECDAPEGPALAILDDIVADLLLASPVVELSGDRLTLGSPEVVAEFIEVPGRPDGTPDTTAPDEPGEVDESVAESRVPDTEWVYVDLTEPPLGLRTWVLVSIEKPGSVTDPVDTEHGGGDGSGGAPALVIGDRTSVVFEGCDIVPLATETRGAEPWLGLVGNGRSFACPEAAEQHIQIMKLLSVGVLPRVHETADGLVLVLANEEGTLVFRDATGGN